jgi:hypothetical protein
MRDSQYRVQYVDEMGEFAFTHALDREGAIAQACAMRLRFIVQAIVDDRTGDIVMNSDKIREEAHRRSRRSRTHHAGL